MSRIVLSCGCSLVLTLYVADGAHAQVITVDWDALPYTSMSSFEAVDSTGLGTYPAMVTRSK